MRIKRFNHGTLLGGDFRSNECDDTQTAMSEIVKRFFNNEPIPNYNQEEVYDYVDETITHTVVHLDENGNPLKDKAGNIISEEHLNFDIINMIPIHPNSEDIDSHGDNSALLKGYETANEKLGAFQRVQARKAEERKAAEKSAAIKIAEEAGYSLSTENKEN